MEPAMSSDMSRNTTSRYRSEYASVTNSVVGMSLATPAPRLPYDDAETPHEMYDDCRAAGLNLHMPVRSAPVDSLTFEGFEPPVRTMIVVPEVPESTARLASTLHLHLD